MGNDMQKPFSYEYSIFITSWKFSIAFILQSVKAHYTGEVIKVNECKGFDSVSLSA